MTKHWHAGILIVATLVLLAGCKPRDKESGGSSTVAGDPFAGGLVWNNWTEPVAGGSGYPAGFDAQMKDFLRCKACHGWDGAGLNGGYVRRTAKDSRPEPTPLADLSVKIGSITAKEVQYSGGRPFTTLNNQMPAYDQPGGLTAKQVADVVAFLNKGPKIRDFTSLDITKKPVTYTFTKPAPTAGGKLYGSQCATCHADDGKGLGMSLVDYFKEDGKYSEGFHKMVYGAGGSSVMTREASGNLSGQQAADILSYIQANMGNQF